MRKEIYLFVDGKPQKTIIRNYTEADFEALIDVQRASFPPPFPEELWWNPQQLSEHVSRFPEGTLCAEVGGRMIGSMTGLIVDMNDYGHSHDWQTITDGGYIRNHNRNGDTLYVVDICVMPEYRKSGIGKWLMQTMYETVVFAGLSRLLGGGRMPGYSEHAHEVSPEVYLEKVLEGEWKDPVITFLLRCGRMPVGLAHNYLEDEQSQNCAVIMEWRNPFI
ncbi:GNAT family N-acetyltransferase [Paenibacillus prosopidis]|uniref:Ribosomal protein S18 acetylase RimI-like enzyme n=1 Tax=Paenibacillus prosopidis TaxID=630520 RepID=A0A368W7W0_9BACL|nr:GNAT family N-acetyltransferase [Paenibacillus prosopidis]RCW50949.1 ribosomal protein S18 acetylase RimI-like enzyme [Paenibacillus prosopidis]